DESGDVLGSSGREYFNEHIPERVREGYRRQKHGGDAGRGQGGDEGVGGNWISAVKDRKTSTQYAGVEVGPDLQLVYEVRRWDGEVYPPYLVYIHCYRIGRVSKARHAKHDNQREQNL